jgi:hypothetical protein
VRVSDDGILTNSADVMAPGRITGELPGTAIPR